MKTRLITAFLGLALMMPLLFLSKTWIFVAAASLMAFIGMLEMMRCLGVHRNIAATWPLYGMAVGLPIAARLLGRINSFGSLTLYVLMAYFFYLMALTVFSHKGLHFAQSAEIFATGTYVSLIFSSIVMLRDAEDGQYLYLLVFLAAWITDSFAYFSGRLFGRHKLIPAVSPKKTVEGAIGGVVFCVIACLGFGLFTAIVWDAEPNYLGLGISGVILSVCAQIGDLIASLIKREHGIKDYGKLFPGHGGVMDRFDSVAAVAVVLLLISALPEMGLF
ncbi:MAG: phosphatidate cytidylyltransferase [Clostridia bacterium]|nr:phosphatidate cytidylyltransferase [Clostridia bacterium]